MAWEEEDCAADRAVGDRSQCVSGQTKRGTGEVGSGWLLILRWRSPQSRILIWSRRLLLYHHRFVHTQRAYSSAPNVPFSPLIQCARRARTVSRPSSRVGVQGAPARPPCRSDPASANGSRRLGVDGDCCRRKCCCSCCGGSGGIEYCCCHGCSPSCCSACSCASSRSCSRAPSRACSCVCAALRGRCTCAAASAALASCIRAPNALFTMQSGTHQCLAERLQASVSTRMPCACKSRFSQTFERQKRQSTEPSSIASTNIQQNLTSVCLPQFPCSQKEHFTAKKKWRRWLLRPSTSASARAYSNETIHRADSQVYGYLEITAANIIS
eukprot:6198022-Pleurochrysis_carterae.AAC.2